MARFLFTPMPFTGHVNPGLPIAQELTRRGHEVRWYTTPRFRDKVEAVGAHYVPYRAAPLIDEERLDEMFPERSRLKGLAQLKYDLKHVFIDPVPAMFQDLDEEMAEWPADVIVGDNCSGVAAMLSESHGTPWAVFGISVMLFSSIDTAPFGTALLPKEGPMGRLRNRLLQGLTDKVLFRDVTAHLGRMRTSLGFRSGDRAMFDFTKDADLYLQMGVPSFEYPRSDLPDSVRFIGAPMPATPAGWSRPAWWSELNSGRKVVLVTQGTIANDYDDLIRPAIHALAREDALVIVTTGSKPPEAVGIDPLPSNVRVEQFVPYAHLMPRVDLLVTNGGFGSVMIALRHGVPVLSVGATEEKPEIANRVQWSGAGLGIKVRRATEAQVRDGVRQVLGDPRFRSRAQAMAYEFAQYDPACLAGDQLEELVCRPAVLPATRVRLIHVQ